MGWCTFKFFFSIELTSQRKYNNVKKIMINVCLNVLSGVPFYFVLLFVIAFSKTRQTTGMK